MGNIHRYQRCILPYTDTQSVQEVHAFSSPGSVLPVQSTTIRSLNSNHGGYNSGQRGQVSCTAKGYKDPPVPRQLVGQNQLPPNLSPTYTNLGSSLSGIGLASEQRQIRTGSKTGFQLVGYQFDVKEGRVRPTQGHWQTVQAKIGDLMICPVCPVWKLMSLIGLLTATEKQVHLGRLHMRPIQWHLKNNWRVPETLEKVIPIPKSLHPHLKWWLEEDSVLTGQPLHPLKHALQIFTDASTEGWDANLNEHTARKTWSLPESKLHINYLELKVVFLALKEFQTSEKSSRPLKRVPDLEQHSYKQHHNGCLHKQGVGDEVGPPVCPSVENPGLVFQETDYSQSSTHSRQADKLSRLGQIIQTEWSFHPEVFQAICPQ